jgi:hypothetical protein
MVENDVDPPVHKVTANKTVNTSACKEEQETQRRTKKMTMMNYCEQ